MPRAIVLDFDGVLADSMPLHAEAYRRTLAEFDVAPSDEEIFRLEGARSESVLRETTKARDVHLDPDTVRGLADKKQRIFQELGPVTLYPGAEDFVRRLHDTGLPLALVTGTRRGNLERIIAHLLDLFDAVLAQDAYTHDKPHPEPYQTAATRLDEAPGHCAVLENAVRGVQSAKDAGYGRVVAITSTMPRAALEEAGADTIVDDYEAAYQALTG